jgi:hypothetical protein
VQRVNRHAVDSSALEPDALAACAINGRRLHRMAALAKAHEPVDCRERIATAGNADDVIDGNSRDDIVAHLACLA